MRTKPIAKPTYIEIKKSEFAIRIKKSGLSSRLRRAKAELEVSWKERKEKKETKDIKNHG